MNGTLKPVVVFGTVCLDRILEVEALPPTGGYAEIIAQERAAGGEALNTAVALATWHAPVRLVGNAVGTDEAASLIRETLRSYPTLDSRWVRADAGVQTPTCDCYITPDGNRTMFGSGFATMSVDTIPPEVWKNAAAFTADCNPGQASVNACLTAADAGIPVVAMDLIDSDDACRAADIILTSSDVLQEHDLGKLAQRAERLRDWWDCHVILTAGEKGAVLARRGNGSVEHVPAFVAPVIVDGTGCGDAFRAGLIYGHYLMEWDLTEAMRFGAAAAALNMGVRGAHAGIQPFNRVLEFAAEARTHMQHHL